MPTGVSILKFDQDAPGSKSQPFQGPLTSNLISPSGFIYEHLVTLSDVDQFKHTSFANYVRLMFVAADTLFLTYLGPEYAAARKMRLKFSKLHFKRQTVVGDVISIRVYDGAAQGSEIPLHFDFVLAGSNEAVATGFQLYEVVSPETEKPLSMTADMTSMIEAIKDPNFSDKEDVEPLEENDWRPNCEVYLYNAVKPFFKHTDYYGHVHPFNYAEWTSFVRESFFSEKCDDFRRIIASEIAMMTSKITVAMLSGSAFADPIQARLTVTRIKKVSFDVVIRYWNDRTKSFVAYTKHTLVFVDPKTGAFNPIPASIRESIAPFAH